MKESIEHLTETLELASEQLEQGLKCGAYWSPLQWDAWAKHLAGLVSIAREEAYSLMLVADTEGVPCAASLPAVD